MENLMLCSIHIYNVYYAYIHILYRDDFMDISDFIPFCPEYNTGLTNNVLIYFKRKIYYIISCPFHVLH